MSQSATAIPLPSNAVHLDFSVSQEEFYHDVIDGLSQPQKTLPCKYFYDELGSALFEDICQLEEYYVTRTEKALMHKITEQVPRLIPKGVTVIEPGSGAGEKIHWLLNALHRPAGYIAMDISKEILIRSCQVIKRAFPSLEVASCVADFNDFEKLSGLLATLQPAHPMLFFPGSTIGNLTPDQAVNFLTNYRTVLLDYAQRTNSKTTQSSWQSLSPSLNPNNDVGSVLIGVDLIKDKATLEAAYDDKQGVTAAFNTNLLTRINRELNADFNLNLFKHKAIFNEAKSRVEMHLVATADHFVTVNDLTFAFTKGETIHTENSYKYTLPDFCDLLRQAGFEPKQVWMDDKEWFSIHHARIC
ncbi:L-histidine N(alpha)-methyltransferase [Flocculibacter collagenilyticus]|uniref:L-histidine N(alpha)-methyltransferase n=1 Tax=Flocculibacter collagenilyticus TaxID=2744479 RepID=UPI0018F4D47B|nr:L-histidine N(alpha)-methyltransferase [Flocculibacter collagenilyticus]